MNKVKENVIVAVVGFTVGTGINLLLQRQLRKKAKRATKEYVVKCAARQADTDAKHSV